jgi:hypothetical protein
VPVLRSDPLERHAAARAHSGLTPAYGGFRS